MSSTASVWYDYFMKFLSIRIEESLHAQAVKAAKAEDRSLAGMIRVMLADRVKRMERADA